MKDLFLNYYYFFVYAIFFTVAVVFAFLINRLFLKFSTTLGIRNQDDGTIIRWGALSKPAVGGLSFYMLFLISVASYSFFFDPTRVLYNYQFIGLLLSLALGFLIGLADDAYDTRPWLKFFVQVACAITLIATGIYIDLFSNMWLNYILTVFWVVGIMNSINMLDNMDGITAIVSFFIIGASTLFIAISQDYNNMHLIICTGVLASLLGFLHFNWHPSRMYMGDTGSQFLGVFLATFGIIYFWNDPYHPEMISIGRNGTITLLAFILPIADTTVVVVNRLAKGTSPFVGGKDHTTHSLAYMGLTDRQVAVVYIMIASISTALVFVIKYMITDWSHYHTAVFGGFFLILVSFFFYTTRSKAKKYKNEISAERSAELRASHS